MLSYNDEKFLELEIDKLLEKEKMIFTDSIRSSQVYIKLHKTNQILTENERKLKNTVEKFFEKISEARTSRYEEGMPSCNDRIKELLGLLNDIERQVQLIEWN